MINWVKEKYLELGRLVQKGFAVLFRFETIGAFISIRGFVVTFLTGCLLVGLAKLSIRLGRRMLRWFRGPREDATSLTAGILFYRRLTQLLSQLELERTPAETQGEFASRAARFLSGRGQPGAVGRGGAAGSGRSLLPRPFRPPRPRAGLAPGARRAARRPGGQPLSWKVSQKSEVSEFASPVVAE